MDCAGELPRLCHEASGLSGRTEGSAAVTDRLPLPDDLEERW